MSFFQKKVPHPESPRSVPEIPGQTREALINSTCADCQSNFLSGKAKKRRNPDGFQVFLTQSRGNL